MNDKRAYIILGAAALLLLIFFIFMQKKGRRFNWNETYLEESREPYGSNITYELLQGYFPNQPFTQLTESAGKTLPDSADGGNYVFIGAALYLDTLSVNKLVAFVESGGKAFISSKTIPYDLMYYLYEECDENYWQDYDFMEDTIVSLNVFHKDLSDSLGFDYKYLYYGETHPYRWQFIDQKYFCEAPYSLFELGAFNEDSINFAGVPLGKGYFYLHTTPLAFTNIQMLDPQGLAYAEKVFSHLQPGPVYWDTHSRTSESVGRRRNQMAGYEDENNSAGANESPLKYVLAHPGLAWGWYLGLALAFLYLLFRAKRRQRIIPVLAENTNTSLEFISTIGRLYFLQNDHRKLSLQKMKLFRNYIRERYNFSISPDDKEFTPKLVARSEVPAEVIDKILLMDGNIRGSQFVSEKTMIDFHQVLDQFYKHCK